MWAKSLHGRRITNLLMCKEEITQTKSYQIMKRVLTIAALSLGMASVASAQYSPEKGDFAVEFGFTPFKAGGETFQLNESMLKARWFISDKNALRLKIGLGIDNTTNTVDNSYNPDSKKWETTYDETKKTKDKYTNFGIMLGYERHLFTKGRFDVYAGLEVGYLMEKSSGSETIDRTSKSYDGDQVISGSQTYSKSTDYTNRSADGKKSSLNAFNANLFAGVDFYVWKNLYLGAEVGFNFKTGKSPNQYYSYTEQSYSYNKSGGLLTSTVTEYDGEANITKRTVVTTGTGATTNTTTNYGTKTSDATTETSFKLFVEPAVRIGWKF